MPQAYTGTNVVGSGTIFTTPREGLFRLELIRFQLTTDATAGVHSAMVTFTDPGAGKPSAEIWDWNEGGASMTLYYTFGIGLKPFNCTVTTGMRIPVHLPDTALWPGTVITAYSVDTALATIAGDTITNVVLYGEVFADIGSPSALAPLLPDFLPGEEAA